MQKEPQDGGGGVGGASDIDDGLALARQRMERSLRELERVRLRERGVVERARERLELPVTHVVAALEAERPGVATAARAWRRATVPSTTAHTGGSLSRG